MKSKNYPKSIAWLERAKHVIPSASQTYSKGYRYYCEGVAPVFADRGRGAHLWDIDGNEFIDTVLGLGAIIIGYQDERISKAVALQLEKGISFTLPSILETKLAEKISSIIPSAQMVRFLKTGSDATSATVRLARAYTGREVVLCCGYHGWHDWAIGITENNLGIPKAVQDLTIPFRYNDLNHLESLLKKNPEKVAAVILEPATNEIPKDDFLRRVKELAHRHGALLIFDEVITGFRYHLSAAQGYFKVTPDLSCFGKAMANGASLSCLVGKREVMQIINEEVFVSTTFGGETLSLAASLATIQILEEKHSYEHLWKIEKTLMRGLYDLIIDMDLGHVVETSQFPAHSSLTFKSVGEKFSSLHLQSYFQQEVIKEGILYLGPQNICLAHTPKDIEKILEGYAVGLEKIKKGLKKNSLPLEGEAIRPIFKRR